MALDMRAMYYILLPDGQEDYGEAAKANENNLNQNFTAIAQKLDDIEERLSRLEG